MSSLRVLAAFSGLGVAVLGCSTSDMPPPAACGDGHSLFYATAGCGAATPAPLCLDDSLTTDGCYSEICDCTGKTRVAICDDRVSTTPWSRRGACGSDDGGADADASDASDAADAIDALGDGKTSD